MEEEQKMFEIRMLEQQYQQLQAQIDSISMVKKEINQLKSELKNLKVGEEILAPVGKGIFVKAKILPGKFNVDIGNKNIVEKDIPETEGIIAEQIKKLKLVQGELEDNIEKIRQEILDKLGRK